MNIILDTHAFLWFVNGSEKLSQKAKEEILNPNNKKYLSYASIWEMGIKYSNKKLNFPVPYMEFLQKQLNDNGFEILYSNLQHIEKFIDLPHHHKDPFDRMILSQAIAENMQIVSVDGIFELYPVKIIW